MPAEQPTAQSTWTTERLELLKSGFEAGLSCREIAAHIGVSRNAVIGKISRLNLTRNKAGVRGPARKDPASAPRSRAIATRLRHHMLRAVPQAMPEPVIEEETIRTAHSCTLFELSNQRCRWPISTPGAEDFCFCGTTPLDGLPYCARHSRLAYRVSAR